MNTVQDESQEEGRRRPARMSIPDEFLCPITHEVMMDPVLSHTGFTFERQAVMEWLVNHSPGTCPMTRRTLGIFDLVSHHTLRTRIQQWLRAQVKTLEDEPDLECEDFEASFLLDEEKNFSIVDANFEYSASASETTSARTPANGAPQVIPVTMSLFSLALRQGKSVPPGFLCPWSQDVMREPIQLMAAGVAMERAALVECLVMSLNHRASPEITFLGDRSTPVFTCPITKKALGPGSLVVHHALRDRIQKWCHEEGYVLVLSDQEGDLGHDHGPDLLWENLVRDAEVAFCKSRPVGKTNQGVRPIKEERSCEPAPV